MLSATTGEQQPQARQQRRYALPSIGQWSNSFCDHPIFDPLSNLTAFGGSAGSSSIKASLLAEQRAKSSTTATTTGSSEIQVAPLSDTDLLVSVAGELRLINLTTCKAAFAAGRDRVASDGVEQYIRDEYNRHSSSQPSGQASTNKKDSGSESDDYEDDAGGEFDYEKTVADAYTNLDATKLAQGAVAEMINVRHKVLVPVVPRREVTPTTNILSGISNESVPLSGQTLAMPRNIHSIIPNTISKLVAVVADSEVMVIQVPDIALVSGGPSQLIPSDSVRIVLHQKFSHSLLHRPLKCMWHPFSPRGTHLVILWDDQTLRLYNVADAASTASTAAQINIVSDIEPELTVKCNANETVFKSYSKSTSTVATHHARATYSANDDDNDSDGGLINTFTFGSPDGLFGESVIYLMRKNGDVMAVCPVMPRQSAISTNQLDRFKAALVMYRNLINEANVSGSSSGSSKGKGNSGVLARVARGAASRAYWLDTLIRSAKPFNGESLHLVSTAGEGNNSNASWNNGVRVQGPLRTLGRSMEESARREEGKNMTVDVQCISIPGSSTSFLASITDAACLDLVAAYEDIHPLWYPPTDASLPASEPSSNAVSRFSTLTSPDSSRIASRVTTNTVSAGAALTQKAQQPTLIHHQPTAHNNAASTNTNTITTTTTTATTTAATPSRRMSAFGSMAASITSTRVGPHASTAATRTATKSKRNALKFDSDDSDDEDADVVVASKLNEEVGLSTPIRNHRAVTFNSTSPTAQPEADPFSSSNAETIPPVSGYESINLVQAMYPNVADPFGVKPPGMKKSSVRGDYGIKVEKEDITVSTGSVTVIETIDFGNGSTVKPSEQPRIQLESANQAIVYLLHSHGVHSINFANPLSQLSKLLQNSPGSSLVEQLSKLPESVVEEVVSTASFAESKRSTLVSGFAVFRDELISHLAIACVQGIQQCIVVPVDAIYSPGTFVSPMEMKLPIDMFTTAVDSSDPATSMLSAKPFTIPTKLSEYAASTVRLPKLPSAAAGSTADEALPFASLSQEAQLDRLNRQREITEKFTKCVDELDERAQFIYDFGNDIKEQFERTIAAAKKVVFHVAALGLDIVADEDAGGVFNRKEKDGDGEAAGPSLSSMHDRSTQLKTRMDAVKLAGADNKARYEKAIKSLLDVAGLAPAPLPPRSEGDEPSKTTAAAAAGFDSELIRQLEADINATQSAMTSNPKFAVKIAEAVHEALGADTAAAEAVASRVKQMEERLITEAELLASTKNVMTDIVTKMKHLSAIHAHLSA
ncbi:hypothetical protein GQ42DRAFT_165762 [Ramicandelaber brevisporus]|nr:hypothetical protein GQ42DRAFT_165861 [Ramicandelaber brevisporus]KAI8866023.1 hypothetical protein GQ42DRAFT_165762 [Ramicandelaber brevisporus]